jgi:C-terminal processing protease CtpA/Prc
MSRLRLLDRSLFLALLLMLAPSRLLAADPEPGGIGIYLGTDESSYPKIMKMIPDSPAAKAKLKEGQVILKVNDVSTKNKTMADWVNLIRGPEGTAVVLEIRDTDGTTIKRLLFRKKIEIPE